MAKKPLAGTASVVAVHPLKTLPRPVRRAIAYLDVHYQRNVSLRTLAAEAGVSAAYLIRAFSAAVGVPPHRYLLHVRIAQARLLLASGRSVIDVAHEVGFADQSHLHRHFRRICGTTPGQYARAARTHRPSRS